MLLFYETLPESVVQTANSMVSIGSWVFSNGVDITEESSGLSIIFYIYNTVQNTAYLPKEVWYMYHIRTSYNDL